MGGERCGFLAVVGQRVVRAGVVAVRVFPVVKVKKQCGSGLLYAAPSAGES
ncbi:MAG: hypothetical protein K2F96_00875 [Muribaculaceae bacterium]|nr:hypothetical protein [Muribaculaceae bacterium]